jgi:hypothetical protein
MEQNRIPAVNSPMSADRLGDYPLLADVRSGYVAEIALNHPDESQGLGKRCLVTKSTPPRS